MEVGEGIPDIDIDPHRVHQVVSNLVANALRQMPHGGRLEVSASSDSETARIEVADTGPGIPDDQLERAFDRFVRSKTREAPVSGYPSLVISSKPTTARPPPPTGRREGRR